MRLPGFFRILNDFSAPGLRIAVGVIGGLLFSSLALSGWGAEIKSPAPVTVVILDPGHGGKDAGLSLAANVAEKDLALRVALLLQRQLQHNPALDVAQTRTGDLSVSVLERSNFANRRNASVFISLHVAKPGDQGNLRVYISRFVKDEELAHLAERETQSDVNVVPWDLAQNKFLSQSKALGEMLIQTWDKNYHLTEKIEAPLAAPLAILAGIRCPAVLVELPASKGLFEKDASRQEIAKVLAEGLTAFLAGK
jgi:N-acetylmuramoyl-L-alanine amidase